MQDRYKLVALLGESNNTGKREDNITNWSSVFRIHMFLGLPDPAPLVRGMDPDTDPDPSISKQQ